MPSQAVHVHIDVEFCGKTYANANYVQGSTVEEAYLRWVPAFGVKNNPARKASIHMALQLTDGSALEADADAKFPSSVERVVLWSSSGWVSSCALCRRLAACDGEAAVAVPKSELPGFHRVERPPALPEAEACAEQEAEACAQLGTEVKKKTKHKKKKTIAAAAAASPLPEAPPSGGEAVLEATIDVDEDEEEEEMEEIAVKSPTTDGYEADGGQMPSDSDDPPVVRGAESRVVRAADAESALAWRVQSEHSRSIDYEDGDDPDLHTVVEQLAGVVRSLASTVRETSVNVAKLQEVAATDHEALQKHLEEAQQDRKVMLRLLSVLAASKQEAPRTSAPDS